MGIGLAEQAHLGAGFDLTGVLIEISTGGDALPLELVELGFKRDSGMLQLGFEVPVAATAEGPPGPFTLHQQAHGHRLDPACGEAPGHFFPQQGRHRVAHQSVEDATGLLGVHQLHVELAGLAQGPFDGVLGDLVEHHPLDRHLGVEQLQQMPADRFPLAVFIRGQEQFISALEGVLELLDDLFLVLRHHIEGLEVVFGVDPGLGPLLRLMARRDLAGVVGQVPHMAHGGLHPERPRQEAADCAGLGGALNNDEGVGHRRRQPNAKGSRSAG